MAEKNVKMSTTDQKAVVSVSKNTLAAKKEAAKKILNAVRNEGAVGVLASYTCLGCFDGIKVKIPSLQAKYMCLVSKHIIGTPSELNESKLENVKEISLNEIPEHFRHGDMMRRLKDGRTNPAVIRHFFISAENCGQEITAMIEVQKKVSLVNGEETIILNIHPSKRERANHELRLGVTPLPGKEILEFSIPDHGELVIAIRPIEQKVRPAKTTASSGNQCPEKTDLATPAKTISQTPAKTSGVKKIVLASGKKKFVLQK